MQVERVEVDKETTRTILGVGLVLEHKVNDYNTIAVTDKDGDKRIFINADYLTERITSRLFSPYDKADYRRALEDVIEIIEGVRDNER